MNLESLDAILKAEPKYRLKQIKKAIFSDLISDWNNASTLPKALREKLNNDSSLLIEFELFKSSDGKTEKALIELARQNRIETVLMKHRDGRNTVCASTQIGCPMNCVFCATGQMGFIRDLTANEIVEQIIFWSRQLKQSQKKS